MKTGTNVTYTLITDSRFCKEPLPELNSLVTNLCNAIEGSLTIPDLHALAPRLLNWEDGTYQYRMTIRMRLLRPMTKDAIYTITNSIKAEPLQFH